MSVKPPLHWYCRQKLSILFIKNEWINTHIVAGTNFSVVAFSESLPRR